MIICLGPICFPVWHLIPVLFLLWARFKVCCCVSNRVFCPQTSRCSCWHLPRAVGGNVAC